ncbi:protein deadpan [Caerostris extrusa]|uniref:Protein deadpan n=1 Tax=Caerostris extrusa TaxID=172846 RepID=A0AAV4RRE7_CAEEX|nr:protein deadpan [Caerostris extrusa]
MNPNSPSNSGDCSNKNNYSKDCNSYHNTSHYNVDNSTVIHSNSHQRELRKSSSKSKSELSYNQIPLAPRRLSNGEWALVLPGNFTLADNEAYNTSAFRITWPSNSSEVDVEQHNLRQQVVSSPLSSSVSDMSSEDYNCRMDVEAAVKTEHEGHVEFGCVWRPW